MRALLQGRFRGGLERALARAGHLLANEVEIFGRLRRLETPVDWHRAPGYLRSWPLVHHSEIAIVGGEAERGDVKDVWELNRHQFLLDLGKAWLVTKETAYLDTIRTMVTGWIEANPAGFGVNWAGPLEVAYRALSWSWVYGLVRDALDDDTHLQWLGAFHDHGAFLYRHLERYSSPYNHLIGQASVLYLLGLWGTEFREAAKWRHRGRQILESTLASQFYADGGSVEQATVYHHATLGFYLLAAVAGRGTSEELSADVWAALERATSFSASLTQPDGRLPALGDNDDAWPILFDRTDGWDYRHFSSTGAVLFSRPDLRHIAGRLHEETVWLLGPPSVAAFDALPAAAPPLHSLLAPSGYAVMRSSWGRDADYVCFDCGEQAGGLHHDGTPSAVHGHADSLSVVLFLGGQPVLVDSGYYTYNGDRAWERHFRETGAHNTVRVDGRDQAVHIDKMAWSHAARVNLEGWGIEWAAASHDGYMRDAPGVRHHRSVVLRNGYLAVGDWLEGDGPHEVEVLFHFAPGLNASCEGDVVLAPPYVLRWAANFPVGADLRRGGPRPQDGWVAPALGERLAAARVALRGAMSPPRARILTVILDTTRWEPVGAESDPADGLLQRSLRDGKVERVKWESLPSTGRTISVVTAFEGDGSTNAR